MQEVFEKIIDRFDELLKAFPTNSTDKFYRGNGFAYKNAIKIVQQVAKEYNNGWIPVTENNLPRENEDVLMVIERKDGNVVVLNETFYKYLLDTPGLIIKYWQPKPKLPLEYQPKGDCE